MEKTKSQVPIDMVEADKLPHETPIKYEEFCQIIGDLYFRLNHDRSSQSEQFTAVVGQLQNRIQSLVAENNRLKQRLSQYESGGQGDISSSDNVGESESRVR